MKSTVTFPQNFVIKMYYYRLNVLFINALTDSFIQKHIIQNA